MIKNRKKKVVQYFFVEHRDVSEYTSRMSISERN